MSTFEQHRLAFADQLRNRREAAGITGSDFAAQLGWNNSKISKIERGRQTPSDQDVVDWLDALKSTEDDIETMRAKLRALRVEQLSWRRQLREGHSSRQEQDAIDEHAAGLIRAVDTAAVPGLLQTPDYARHIFRSQALLLGVADDIDAAVRVRMQRQGVLYSAGKTIEILMTESALRSPICPPEIMAGQIDRLVGALGLPNVRVGILPLGKQLAHVPWHGYWIVDDVVLVETITDELRVRDPEHVAIYNTLTDRLWKAAAQGDDARAILTRLLA
ncbi:MAG: helix-turn-helix domain-containing protein [Pseudonocardiaceae bacterium]